jgi:hypothetical protein
MHRTLSDNKIVPDNSIEDVKATRDLLKSLGWGIAGTPSIRCSDEVATSSPPTP